MTTRLYAAYRFFHEHAGWSTPPGRAVCAWNLAKAEQWALDEGLEFEWMDDELPWEGDGEYEPEVVLCCFVEFGDESGNETASLCGIDDPSDEYRRVVEAELALEIQTPFFEAIAKRILSL